MNRQQLSWLLTGAMVLGVAGCCCGRTRNQAGYLMPRLPGEIPCASCRGPSPQPPRFSPAPPPGAPVGGIPIPTTPPPGGGIQQNAFIPDAPANGGAAPAAPGVRLDAPEPVEPAQPMPNGPPSQPPTQSTRPYTPQTQEPPPAPPAKDDRNASPALPVDIPQFAIARPNVASGHEPFAGGVAWLKAHGYRTVLHVRAPGEDDSAARRQFEQSGLRFLSLEVSPQTLSREIVDQFNRLVTDASLQPLFVYDKDSSLAGGLWYLHFRLSVKESEDKARADAAQLGFRQDQDGSHRTMWVAIQNFMRNEKP